MYRQGKWIGSKRVRRGVADLLRQVKPVGKVEAYEALCRMQYERPLNNIIYLAVNHKWFHGPYAGQCHANR